MFDIGTPREVFDLSDWLPSYGATSVEVHRRARRWTVRVFYDAPDGSPLARDIDFMGACNLHWSVFPGVQMTRTRIADIEDDVAKTFPHSEASRAWSAHLGRSVNHYLVYFRGVEIYVEAIAESVSLGEAASVSPLHDSERRE